jgi:hypothetical protein
LGLVAQTRVGDLFGREQTSDLVSESFVEIAVAALLPAIQAEHGKIELS